MLTAVRRRVSWDRHQPRGRKVDPAWAHRLLLLRGYGTLTQHGRARLEQVLTQEPLRHPGDHKNPKAPPTCHPRRLVPENDP